MSLITAGELASKDYEWLNERLDTLSPEFDCTKGRTVFTYIIDGFTGGRHNLRFALTLRIDSKNHTAVIYCKAYEIQDKTVAIEYDYEKAVEIEKVFSRNIPKITDRRRYIYIDGYRSFIMFNTGDIIDWHCNIPDEWKMYRDCIRELYGCVDKQYPMTYEKDFYTKYESRLYSSESGTTGSTLVKNGAKIYFVHRWSKCYDEVKQKPVLKLHYGKKMLVLVMSVDERKKIEKDLFHKLFIKLSDYEIETIEVCRSDYKGD